MNKKDTLGQRVLKNNFDQFMSEQKTKIEKAREILQEKNLIEWYTKKLKNIKKLDKQEQQDAYNKIFKEVYEITGINLNMLESIKELHKAGMEFKEENPELFK